MNMASKSPKSYYGIFLWLSLAAFVAPIFVGIRAFQSAPRPHTQPVPKPDASGVDHQLWDYLLKTYVENGSIDYDGLARNHLFKAYITQLGKARPEALATGKERLALLCNAYNALVIYGVINHKIKSTVMDFNRDGKGFFDVKEYIFAGETVSLNHIEHNLVRPVFKEPRIHMALVCAARSCPAIRAEAYRAADLDRQLEDQARLFANNPDHIRYDKESDRLYLSAILKWYGEDFQGAEGYLDFMAERVEDSAMRDVLTKAKAGEIETAFSKYDWALNTQGKAAASTGGGKGEFGSGSVPNE
jgi:hypothetical protein